MNFLQGLSLAMAKRYPSQQHLRYFFSLIAAIGALLIGEHIYLREYLTTDENSYLFQAWLFLQGQTSLECPAIKDVLFHPMIICDKEAGWLSRYPPAHSLWLLPGVAIGYPRLMSAIAAFLAVWFLSKAGERLKIPVWVTGILLLVSPYFWLMYGSVLSHTSGLMATAIMIWAYLVWLQERKLAYAALAGLAWSFLFLSRTYTALWLALPFSIDALTRLTYTRSREALIGTTVFAVFSLLGVCFFLFYNAITTGDPFFSTFLYYEPSEGPGFGEVNGKMHTMAIGWEFLKFNVNNLNSNLWGFKGSLIVLLALTIVGYRKEITPLLLASTILVWLAYMAFWFRGINELSPIYFYETLAFIVLSAGMGVTRLYRANWHFPSWGKPLLGCLLLVVTGAYAKVTFVENAKIIMQRNSYTSAFQQVIRDVPTGSIVLLEKVHKDIRAQNSWNPQGLNSDPLVLHNYYGIQNVLPYMFPNRPVYVVSGHRAKPAVLLNNTGTRFVAIEAAHMRTSIGKRSTSPDGNISYVAVSKTHKKGVLAEGVKQYLAPGRYVAKITFSASGLVGEEVGRILVVNKTDGSNLLDRTFISGDIDMPLVFEVPSVSLVEPIIYFSGNGRLEFERIIIEQIDEDNKLISQEF